MITHIILLIIAIIIMLRILIKTTRGINWQKEKKIIKESNKEFNELLTFEELLEDEEGEQDENN
jgi:hypothetical protein